MQTLQTPMTIKALIFAITSLACQAAFSEDLTGQLTQKFQARMSVLDRELMTFRYESHPKENMKTAKDIEARVRNRPERFFKKDVTSYDAAGPGSYVAIDPVASRSFGGDTPQLYVFNLKKGTRILNLERSFTSEEKDLIKKIHNELQCKMKRSNEETLIEEKDMNLFSLRQSSTEACRETAIAIAKTLKVQAIMYSYLASNSLADCRNRSVALNIISAEAIDFKTVVFYSDQYSIDDMDTGRFIKKLYDESDDDFSFSNLSKLGNPMPVELEKKTLASNTEYSPWKQSKIFNCGPKWTPEDKQSLVTAAFNENLKLNFTDPEIQNLLINLGTTFKAKAGASVYFDSSQITKFQRLTFKVSGLPQDETTFARFFQIQNQFYDKQNQEEIKKLYGIKKTIAELGDITSEADEIAKRMSPSERKSPDFYFRILAHFEITGGYALVSLNKMNMYRGGVLLSSADPKKSFAENIAISKQAYKNAISECISLYSDVNLTYEDIQKTDCSFVTR